MEYSVSPNCDVMQTYVDSIELRISLIVNLIIAIVAFPILVKSIIYIWKTDTFHRNTKMQIFVHLIALLIHVIGRLGLHSLDLFNYFSLGGNSSACEIIPKFYRCLILRAFYNIGLALSSMCSICLVLERYASTVFSSNYEHCGPNYGIALVSVQILLATSFIGSLYFYASFQPGNNVLYYCQTIASSRGNIFFVVIPLYFILATQIIARLMFKVLMRKNQKLRTRQTISLSTRYNLDQSI
ncbi:unnamed protein product [Caenorhabditis angaria]|uniref:Uncharacterized protein n=1 Tax=Caenorhabditis angaria TaxID=860376 RepID=A0A9P1IVA0_9PELO|nr:unnamed protein product [Caenorhabditis angaria]